MVLHVLQRPPRLAKTISTWKVVSTDAGWTHVGGWSQLLDHAIKNAGVHERLFTDFIHSVHKIL